ncbi:SGNH/GDSL hydrolase family protein [Paenibacillus oryzisoli]|uniref:SGNH/GDSL hydrolase family protein n=1 Tax=Paenibacillus oryzisoli TaxID=1850517 RepID=UPI003D2D6519
MHIWNYRRALTHMRHKLREGELRVGFLGGSITDALPGHNWPEPVMRWLVARYPEVRFHVENAAISATGSDLAVFRAERDIIDRACDLVFVEYAVNDRDVDPARRIKAREGLLRKLLADGTREVVLVYTFHQTLYAEMMSGIVPDTIAEFERLAEHYGISSVWMGAYALNEVKQGFLRWEEWLPDGTHPTQRGSLSYGQSVIKLLEQELQEGGVGAAASYELPEPIDPGHWGGAYVLPLERIRTEGPWLIRRWPNAAWIDRVLDTAAVGARLSLDFEGSGLVLAFDYGKLSAEFRYRLDGGEWVTTDRPRPDWCGNEGWFRSEIVAEGLPAGAHVLELEVIHGNRPGAKGTNFRLAFAGVIV